MELQMNSSVFKRQSGQRPKKKKFQGNQHKNKECIKPDITCMKSSSSRKLEKETNFTPSKMFSGYRMIDISILFRNIENFLICKSCHGTVILKEKSLCGLSSSFIITCKNCDKVNEFKSNSMIGNKNNIPEINRRAVFAMRCVGKGLSGLQTFCNVMCLPTPISQKSYDAVNKQLSIAASSVAVSSMKDAVTQEIEINEGNCDITVSGDGTWKTRGHSSLVGACSVIGANTGKVIDCHVMSSYCKGCESYKGAKSGTDFQKWKKKHSLNCKKNHCGSAAKMEVDGMLKIFFRSVAERGVRYINYIGDGDTKTYLSLKNADPYDGINIEKTECVGHIQKRMGSRLRKLKSQMQSTKLSDGKTIGGKGRLTDTLILKLTSFYGNAIRENKNDLHSMRQAVWAVWSHTASTDKNPMHYFCPKGKNTWCSYNRAIYEKKPFKHSVTVSNPVMLAIKPIFKDLCEPALMKRCLGGKTQNSNESFNSTLWKYCPKTIGSGKQVADIAAYMATVIFNDGTRGILKIMQELNLSITKQLIENFVKNDSERVKTAEVRALAATHEARKHRKRQKTMHYESQKKAEGEIYAAGAF